MKNGKTEKDAKRGLKMSKMPGVGRLLAANAVAFLLLVTVTVAVLWRLGLLESVWASLFPKR